MKFPTILSIVCLGIGVAIGWIAKPSSDSSDSELAEANPPKVSSREVKATASTPAESDRRSTRSTREADRPRERSPERETRREQMEQGFADMMKKRQQAKLNARISRLVAQLNLTSEQEAALRKAAAENQVDAAAMMSDDFDPSKLASLTGDGPLEDALEKILTGDQKAEHEALKKRELANKVESKALKELAKLSGLDMTQEQKDAAYDILYKNAEETTANESPANGILSAFTEGLGIELNADDLGIDLSVLNEEMANRGEDGEPSNEQDIMARMREGQQKKIDEKVEALRPVLNDDQLEQYRKSLELKQGGILGGFLGGFGEEESE